MSSSIPGLGGRREAREEALAVLYEVEATGATVDEALAGRPIAIADYAAEMARGVAAELATLDDVIRRNLTGWTLERLAVVDRILVRMGAWELLSRPDIPTGVVLSEAVELASLYSGEESPRFVNGLLRAVADEVRERGPS